MSSMEAKSRFRPDVGRQRFQQALARGNIAGDGTCLDEGGALPVLAATLVVAFGGGKRDSDGRTAGIGAEAEVGSEDIALRRPLLKHLHEIFRQAHEELTVIEPLLQRQFARLVEDDEIDVARIVEFAGAVFAHPEDDEARSFRRHFLRRPQHLPARCGISQKPEDGTFDGAVGKGRERFRHLLELPGAGDVGHCDQERGFRLRKAKRRHDIRLLVEIARGMDPGQEIAKRFARRALEKARQPVGVKPENAAKRRGVAEQRGRQVVNALVLEERGDGPVFQAGDGGLEIFHLARDAIGVVGRRRPVRHITQRLRVFRTRSLACFLFQQQIPTIESGLVATQQFPQMIPAIAAPAQ